MELRATLNWLEYRVNDFFSPNRGFADSNATAEATTMQNKNKIDLLNFFN